jgi:hypothetical protein
MSVTRGKKLVVLVGQKKAVATRCVTPQVGGVVQIAGNGYDRTDRRGGVSDTGFCWGPCLGWGEPAWAQGVLHGLHQESAGTAGRVGKAAPGRIDQSWPVRRKDDCTRIVYRASQSGAVNRYGWRTAEVRRLHRDFSGMFTSKSPWPRAFVLACQRQSFASSVTRGSSSPARVASITATARSEHC